MEEKKDTVRLYTPTSLQTWIYILLCWGCRQNGFLGHLLPEVPQGSRPGCKRRFMRDAKGLLRRGSSVTNASVFRHLLLPALNSVFLYNKPRFCQNAFQVWQAKCVLTVSPTFFFKLIYIFLAFFGLRCCTWSFSSCGERGLLFVAVRGLLNVVASRVAARGL